MIGTSISHYDIIKEIGRGGMGVVYQAEDNRLGRSVALKFLADHLVLDAAARDRFMQEARSAAALGHPNIATLFDIEESDGRMFITMEYIDGRGLDEMLKEGPISPAQTIDIMLQVVRGLESAHELGIVHRDIKPGNIMVTDRGAAKILDFGLAKISGSIFQSKSGSVVGTAAYMSPQQIRGEMVNRQTDLWSLGVVLYEMLTGELPFAGDTEQALYYSIVNVDPRPIGEINQHLGSIFDPLIKKLLAKELDRRVSDISEVITDLERAKTRSIPQGIEVRVQKRSSLSDASGMSSVQNRRQITVLYCEIANFGDLSESMDPEDLFDIGAEYSIIWESLISRFEGIATKYSGGSMVGYFGYPTAHENDGRRALSCGLAIAKAITDLHATATALSQSKPQVRIAVHAGIAIVREEPDGLRVHGNIENVASGIAAYAEEGSVVATKSACQLARGYFEIVSVGDKEVKGISNPLAVFEVVRESGAHSRIDFVEESELSPFVGRDAEMRMIEKRWQRARSGEGSAVVVSGEAGIGKSRLISAFLTKIQADEEVWSAHIFCSPFHGNSALFPFVDFLSQEVWSARVEDERPFSQLREYVTGLGLATDSNLYLLADLLGVEVPDNVERPDLAPAAQKLATLQVLLQVLCSRSAEQPGIIVLEDLHWADPSTRDWIEILIGQLPAQQLLVLFTTRPGYRPPWLGRAGTRELTLDRLDKNDLLTISSHRGGKQLPQEILDKIAEKTDGIPLFAEELTNMIVESGLLKDKGDHYSLEGPIPDNLIPDTLQGSLLARLDHLASEKYLAEIGAVLGRQFSFEMLEAVSGEDVSVLTRDLSALINAELIYERGFIPHSTYVFKHALVRDAAYNGMLRNRKSALHESVAVALQQTTTPAKPEVIAYHYTSAGNAASAIPFWLNAGQRAMARYENHEAVQHLTAGRSLINDLPESNDRDLMELGLLVPLGHALNMTKGYWGPEGEAAFSRATELCGKVESFEPLIYALLGLGTSCMVRGDYEKAKNFAMQARKTAVNIGSDDYKVTSEITLSAYHLFRGELQETIDHANVVTENYNPTLHDPLRQLGTGTLNFTSRIYVLSAQHMMGLIDTADAGFKQMIVEAEQGNYHFDYYMAYLFYALMQLAKRDFDECRTAMETYLVAGVKYGDPFPVAITTIVHHLALRGPENEETFRSAKVILDQMRATGYGLGYTLLLGQYAAGLIDYGDYDGAQAAIDEAFEHLQVVETELWEAEIYRLQGELDLIKGQPPERVKDSFVQALEIARKQGARVFELRAATSLARLWKETNKSAEAHQLLANIYSSFTEGFDAPDLLEAKEIMSDLLVS